jgi:hypothetical protein
MRKLIGMLMLAFAVSGYLGYRLDHSGWKYAGASDVLVKNGAVTVSPPFEHWAEFREPFDPSLYDKDSRRIPSDRLSSD